MHGLIFETSIWLLAGSTRLHLHTSTELRSSVACAQPDLFNKSLTTESGYKTLSHTTVQSSINVDCMDNFPRLAICQATTLPASPKTDVNNTTLFNFSFGFLPNTVSELAAAIRMDNSHKTTPAICQFIHSSFSASKPPRGSRWPIVALQHSVLRNFLGAS